MDQTLEHFTVLADRESGFWIGTPTPTGKTVARDEWQRMQKDDPEHFQIVQFVPSDQPPALSMTDGVVLERALSITWSDEPLQ